MPERAHFRLQIFESGQQSAGPFAEKFSGRRRNQAAAAPVEQPAAEFVLQLPQLLADRRLGDAELPGGLRYAAALHDLPEICELYEIHGETSPFLLFIQYILLPAKRK